MYRSLSSACAVASVCLHLFVCCCLRMCVGFWFICVSASVSLFFSFSISVTVTTTAFNKTHGNSAASVELGDRPLEHDDTFYRGLMARLGGRHECAHQIFVSIRPVHPRVDALVRRLHLEPVLKYT